MIRLILLRLLESYFRHRWLYLLPVLLMAGAMALYMVIVPAPYIAEGTLYVQQETLLSSLTSVRSSGLGFRYVTPAEETVGELYQLMNSEGFIRAIIQQTDLEAKMGAGPTLVEQIIKETREAVWFRSLGNNLVMVSAQYTMPRVSAQLVAATVETYTRWKTNISREESVAARDFFKDLVGSYRLALDAERSTLTDYLVAHQEPVRGARPPTEAARISQLEAAVSLAEERLRAAENKEEDAQLALAQTESNIRQSYFVVDVAKQPLEPKRSKKELVMIAAIFLMAGAFFSLAGIVGGALLDRTLRFPVDVKHGLALPVLVAIPEAAEPALVASRLPAANLPARIGQRPAPVTNGANTGTVINGHAPTGQRNGVTDESESPSEHGPKREHPLKQLLGYK